MKRFLFKAWVVALIVLWSQLLLSPQSLWGHHPGHAMGSGFSLFNPFSTESRPPKTYLALDLSVDGLDDHLGIVAKYQLSGEYAIHKRISVGLRLPFASIRENFLPKDTSIGDVALTFKSLLWSTKDSRMSLTFGEVTSFPTGDQNSGFGAGEVIFSPYLTWSSRWHENFETFLTLGTSVMAANQASPTFDFSAGMSVPLVKGKTPLKGFLALQGSTNLANDSLSVGSTKAFLNPALIWQMSDKLSTTWGFRFSVIDTLDLKPGEILSPISPLLLTDVKYGFVFNTTYAF